MDGHQGEQLMPRQLYGGAITVELPTRFHDISDLRPVPDHQEVWADPAEDQSLIVEIVEHDNSVSDADCGMHYWNDQVMHNECVNASVQGIQQLGLNDLPGLPSDAVSYACIVSGVQTVSKGRQSSAAANQVSVLLVVLRLPQVRSDVLITLNSPLIISPASQAADQAGAGFKYRHEQATGLLMGMLSTLNIHDWHLFGN